MADQVLPASPLPDGAVMHVFERAVILADGTTVWLRRFTLDEQGRRTPLRDGRWCATRGGLPAHLYAVPLDATHGAGSEWRYLTPHSFPTWEAALDAAVSAEAAEQAARERKRRSAS